VVFAILLAAIHYFDKRSCLLRDISKAKSHQPYSWSRVQLAWWSSIILSCFITVFWSKGVPPTLDSSTIILLGISTGTTAMARTIDVSDMERLGRIRRHQDDFGKYFLIDIMSDETGVSIHRMQTVLFNAVFGIWFIYGFLHNLSANDCNLYINSPDWFAACNKDHIDYLIPPISQNNLILLGVSSAAYAALKTTENPSANPQADLPDAYKDASIPSPTPTPPPAVPKPGGISQP
jgi:hypothetical protein